MKSGVKLVPVPRPVRTLALRVALARRPALSTHLQLYPLGCKDEAVLVGVLYVLWCDAHPPGREDRHGRAGRVFEEADAVIAVFSEKFPLDANQLEIKGCMVEFVEMHPVAAAEPRRRSLVGGRSEIKKMLEGLARSLKNEE